MFTADAPFALFDYHRVPYDVAAPAGGSGASARVHRLRRTDAPGSPALLWTQARRLGAGERYAGPFEVAGCRVAGHVATAPLRLVRDAAGSAEDPGAGGWRTLHEVTDLGGRPVSAVVTNDRGDVLLPFDPGEVMECLWSERYRRLGRPAQARALARRTAVRAWYRLRPALPRALQLAVRRRLAPHAPSPSDFPRWPLETGLHDLYDLLLGLCADLAGEPVPALAPWPDGATWCLLLTHDVETADGVAAVERLREPERARGLRSSWNFVPERYETPTAVLDALRAEGCEIGVHGLRHDGHDLASARALQRRLPGIRAAALRWGAVGFRSPATQRGWDLMPVLGFDYDSSSTDTDPYEPQPGGCGTFWPFLNRDLVELPITLPQDHTLFAVLGHRDGRLWTAKAGELRARGGLVLVLSHPDYAEGPALAAWTELLDHVGDDPTSWHALPREVAQWWRARAASSVVRRDGAWVVVGPAADRARITTAPGPGPGPGPAGPTEPAGHARPASTRESV